MTNTTIKSLGGYSLVSVKEAGGEETVRFTAYIAKDGKKIMQVSNDGVGGCHRYDPPVGFKTEAAAAKGYAEFRAAQATFEEFATQWNAGNEFAGIEDDDQFVNHLMEVADLNRMRRTVFLLDDEDYFATGAGRVFKGATYEQTVGALRSPAFAGRNPRVWDKTQSAFVPVS